MVNNVTLIIEDIVFIVNEIIRSHNVLFVKNVMLIFTHADAHLSVPRQHIFQVYFTRRVFHEYIGAVYVGNRLFVHGLIIEVIIH